MFILVSLLSNKIVLKFSFKYLSPKLVWTCTTFNSNCINRTQTALTV